MNSHDTDTTRPLITLSGVGMQYDGGRTVLDDINATVRHGDFVAITGPNGGGKTTLLRIILGLLRPTRGTVDYCGGCSPAIGYLPQKNSIDSHFPITVREVVATGLLADRSLSASEKAARTDEYIRLVDLAAHADHPIGRLSGGQLQRALLGRALVSRPTMLVMDEPLSYLDKHFEAHLYDILSSVREHSTILLVSHEMSHIDSMATCHWIVDRTLHRCNAPHHFGHSGCDENDNTL
ncbi:MAG: ATP-binding cassette domain-containing protein [Muribaculaceae bacterium]|nr:ATP-binding cassette domain-containing protein [Muribaculaceae bacterium]